MQFLYKTWYFYRVLESRNSERIPTFPGWPTQDVPGLNTSMPSTCLHIVKGKKNKDVTDHSPTYISWWVGLFHIKNKTLFQIKLYTLTW